jgi:hypothetical protein
VSGGQFLFKSFEKVDGYVDACNDLEKQLIEATIAYHYKKPAHIMQRSIRRDKKLKKRMQNIKQSFVVTARVVLESLLNENVNECIDIVCDCDPRSLEAPYKTMKIFKIMRLWLKHNRLNTVDHEYDYEKFGTHLLERLQRFKNMNAKSRFSSGKDNGLMPLCWLIFFLHCCGVSSISFLNCVFLIVN